jgi:hypothetical protein
MNEGPPQEGTMGKRRDQTRKSAHRRLVTTIGELIAAAYEAVPGMGSQKTEGARTLLTRSPLARHISPHLEFVR